MKADFIAAHRPAIVDMLTDHMAAIRWFLDPANRNDALAMTHAFTKQSLQSLDYAFTKNDVYRSPDLMPVIPPIQKDIDIAVGMKMLPASIEASRNMSTCRWSPEAAKRFATRNSHGNALFLFIMPAKARIRVVPWVPAFAGKTIGCCFRGVARRCGDHDAVQ